MLTAKVVGPVLVFKLPSDYYGPYPTQWRECERPNCPEHGRKHWERWVARDRQQGTFVESDVT